MIINLDKLKEVEQKTGKVVGDMKDIEHVLDNIILDWINPKELVFTRDILLNSLIFSIANKIKLRTAGAPNPKKKVATPVNAGILDLKFSIFINAFYKILNFILKSFFSEFLRMIHYCFFVKGSRLI